MEQQSFFFFYCPFSESSQRKNDKGARQTGRSRHTSDQNICQAMMITVVSLRLKFEVL